MTLLFKHTSGNFCHVTKVQLLSNVDLIAL